MYRRMAPQKRSNSTHRAFSNVICVKDPVHAAFFLQKSRRISHTGFLHVPRSWLEDTNPPLVGIAGSVLANYRAYRCFVSAWTAKQKRRHMTRAHPDWGSCF